MRKRFTKRLLELAKKDKNILLLTGDLGYGLFDEYREKLPYQFLNCGISEQNMINVSAGLSMTGHNVFAYSISPFLIQRTFEQIKINLCHDNNAVKLLGAGGGCLYGAEGFTHHATEDIGLMKLLPNMKIVCPANYQEMDGLFDQIVESKTPVYVRFGKKCDEQIYPKGTEFKLGKPNFVCEGKKNLDKNDILIISTGTALSECYKAVKMLNKKKIYPTLLSVHSLPLIEDITKYISHNYYFLYETVVIIEDHRRTGGLCSSILENLDMSNCNNCITIEQISFPDKFIDDVGTADEIYEKYGLTAEKIAGKIEVIYHGI